MKRLFYGKVLGSDQNGSPLVDKIKVLEPLSDFEDKKAPRFRHYKYRVKVLNEIGAGDYILEFDAEHDLKIGNIYGTEGIIFEVVELLGSCDLLDMHFIPDTKDGFYFHD